MARVGLRCLVTVVLIASVGTATASPVDDIEARVRQIYFEGYPIAASGRLDADQVARLGELLRDESEQAYWANIVLALGASENAAAYPQLADFASRPPEGEVASGVYQAWVSLPVALGVLAHDYPAAFERLEQMVRDTGSAPGWRFQSLEGASLASALRRSAITGVGVSGRPEAAVVLNDLRTRAATHAAPSAAPAVDDLVQHIESALRLQTRSAADGPQSVLRRTPVAR